MDRILRYPYGKNEESFANCKLKKKKTSITVRRQLQAFESNV